MKDLEADIRSRMILDLLSKGWDVEAVAHVFGHGKASAKELKIALSKMTSKSVLKYF